MRAVLWEDTLCAAEVSSMEGLRPSRMWTIVSTAFQVEGKEVALSTAAARSLLPVSPLGLISC